MYATDANERPGGGVGWDGGFNHGWPLIGALGGIRDGSPGNSC